MTQLGRFRIFAGHYQFILCDKDADPLHDPPKWRSATTTGYVASESAALVGSKANLNDIVVAVELSETAPTDSDSQSHLIFPLDVPSGKLLVTSLDGLHDPNTVSIAAGKYQCHVLSYNLGMDELTTGELLKPGGDERLSDRERFARLDYEHHRVVLVPLRSADASEREAG